MLTGSAFGQSYSGYSYSVGNDIRYFYGNVDLPKQQQSSEFDAYIAQSQRLTEQGYQRMAANRQLAELQRQTQLLEQIANRK